MTAMGNGFPKMTSKLAYAPIGHLKQFRAYKSIPS
jgi:hypothetical protein